MKVITPGHSYALANHENQGAEQVLHFIHKEPVKPGSKVLRTVRVGTTNEEVLDVLIDRMGHLQAKMPCEENEQATEHLRQAKAILLERTAKRKAANVEGTHEPLPEKPAEQAAE